MKHGFCVWANRLGRLRVFFDDVVRTMWRFVSSCLFIYKENVWNRGSSNCSGSPRDSEAPEAHQTQLTASREGQDVLTASLGLRGKLLFISRLYMDVSGTVQNIAPGFSVINTFQGLSKGRCAWQNAVCESICHRWNKTAVYLQISADTKQMLLLTLLSFPNC